MNQHSIFSNYLSDLNSSGLTKLQEESTVIDMYDQLRIAYNQGAVIILDLVPIILPLLENGEIDHDFIDAEEIYFLKCTNKAFNDWLKYVNRVITLNIGKLDLTTLVVRSRIAQNMLDKIDISERIKWKICYNLRENLWNETRIITNPQLPF